MFRLILFALYIIASRSTLQDLMTLLCLEELKELEEPPWELKRNHLKTHCTKHILKKQEYLKKPKLGFQECKLKNDNHEISNGNKLCFSKRALLNNLPE